MTSPLEEDEAYRRFVDGEVARAVALGAASFNDVMASLPGVYPTSALQSIERLGQTKVFVQKALGKIRSSAYVQAKTAVPNPPACPLPIPHPLDYEWRFSAAATGRLVHECSALTRAGDTVALLGMPSVFCAAAHSRARTRSWLLLDANDAAINCLADVSRHGAVVRYDVGTGRAPDIKAHAVALDAPWYPEETKAFLWTATQVCVPGGRVLASIPPVGTRPGIDQEWAGILAEAGRMGLDFASMERSALPYLSPPFELNALRASGMLGVSPEWRRGDLAVFTRSMRKAVPPVSALPRRLQWPEVAVEGVRIRVRPSESVAFADPGLLELVQGDVLPTVSRRDRRREQADVWTSGNRVFRCRGAAIFLKVLHALATGSDPDEAVSRYINRTLAQEEQKMIEYAANQASRFIAEERNENLAYGY